MRKVLTLALTLALPLVAEAQDMTKRTYHLREVVVRPERGLKEIGVQQTVFDSLALKENVALSMADVLTFNSSVFVKSYGRATLSTVAFRGTSPSHTQVTWNGMRINNPMLGMTDFSTIPSYFIDRASLLHGTSSVNETGGGLGGLVKLSTAPSQTDGLQMQYVQGVGSFSTFDEFLRIGFGSKHWQTSTRVVFSSSPNDFTYRNHDKKTLVYDDDHNIVGSYYPKEKNHSGSFSDFHALQEVYYNTLKGDRLGLSVWLTGSNRELPMLTTDYGKDFDFDNRQREWTLRSVLSWAHSHEKWSSDIRSGYVHTWMAYDYKRDVGNGEMAVMTRSRSLINTFYGQGEFNFRPTEKWLLTANLSAHQHLVRSEDKNIIKQDGDKAIVGYDKGRVELSGNVSARWQPVERMGMSVVLREEMFGTTWAPLIPAFFVDGILSKRCNVVAKASVSRNFRFPSLNDLYFLPGGNPDLKSERGVTYDVGLSFDTGMKPLSKTSVWSLNGGVNWFDSHIDDWIIWLPTTKGFFSPRNVKQVHAYGIEAKAALTLVPAKDWQIDLSGNYSWTPSINEGEKMTQADKSVGKQLPYVPRNSASAIGRVAWRGWALQYKWCWYSERFTMSSNDRSITGHLPQYFMNNLSLEKNLGTRACDFNFKAAVNNLFNEEYLSVLSRPMPGINFEFFVSITPKFGKKE